MNQSCPGTTSARLKAQKRARIQMRDLLCPNRSASDRHRMSGSVCARKKNEWLWRSGVDKIRGERQDGCSHDQRSEKTRRSTSDWFPKHQQERESGRGRHQLVKYRIVLTKLCQMALIICEEVPKKLNICYKINVGADVRSSLQVVSPLVITIRAGGAFLKTRSRFTKLSTFLVL